MILVESLLYKIDLKLNKLASNIHQGIPLEDKILALNEAQIKLIKKKIGINNVYQLGFDSFKKRYEDLQSLVEKETLALEEDKSSKKGRWTADITKLENKYMFYVDSFITASKQNCKGRVIQNRVVKHADLEVAMNNNHYKPSFEYQETLATISGNKVEVFTNNEFTPDKLYITYLRYPKKIDYEGYIDFNNEESKTQNCELADYMEDELVDLAVQELAMSTENIPAAEFSQQRKQDNE